MRPTPLKRSSARASRPFSEPVGVFVSLCEPSCRGLFGGLPFHLPCCASSHVVPRLPRVAIVYRLGEAVQPFGIISSMFCSAVRSRR